MTGEPVLLATRCNLLLPASVPDTALPLTGALKSQPMPVEPLASVSAIELMQKSKFTSVAVLGTWTIVCASGVVPSYAVPSPPGQHSVLNDAQGTKIFSPPVPISAHQR